MAAARTPASTSRAKADYELILYRLTAVEGAVKEVGVKLDKQDNIKPKDLDALRDYLKEAILAIRTDLQKQIDDKADQSQVDDLRTLVKAVAGFFTSILAALVVYYLTNQ